MWQGFVLPPSAARGSPAAPATPPPRSEWAEADELLAETLDVGETLRRLSRILVPGLCDWVVVYEALAGGGLRRLALSHRDPARLPLVEELEARYPQGPQAEGTPLARVLREGERVLVERVTDEMLRRGARDERHLDLMRRLGVRSAILVPLVSRGRVLGAMSLALGDSDRAYTEDDLARVAALGRRAGAALDNARLYESERAARLAAEARAERLQRLHGLASALDRAASPEEAGDALLAALLQEPGASAAVVHLLDEAGRSLGLLRASGYREGRLAGWESLPLDAPLPAAECVREARPALLGSRDDLVRYPALARAPLDNQAWACLPLVCEGRPVGAVCVAFREARAFAPEDVAFLETLAGQGALAIRRALGHRQLERQVEERARAEAWLRGIFDAVDVGLLAVDWPARRITRFNAAAQRIFGYSEEEVLGKGTEILHVDEERFFAFGRVLAEAFRRDEPASFEFQMRRKDGAVFPTEHFVALLRDARGQPIGGVCLTRDLTARKRQEAELAAARAEVARQEKLSALGTLVGGVAHEIRTPLTYLQTNLHLLQSRVEEALRLAPPEEARRLQEPVRQHAREALDAAERMDRLVEDLRRFTRLSPGAHAPVDLPAAVAAAVDLFRATHGEEVQVQADLAPTPPVRGDGVQVQQVVLNLLENAADARPASGAVRVRTRPTPDGGALLEVEDDGHGIPDHVRAQMFEPFFTTKPLGSGLGLSIVKRIVDDHHALIRCESTEERGTTFHVLFPGLS